MRSYAGRHYLKGSFGCRVDDFATRFDEVWLLTCAKAIPAPIDEYQLRSKNIAIIPIPEIEHQRRLVRSMRKLWGVLSSAWQLSFVIWQCDVIHPRLPSPIGMVGTVAAKVTRKPLFVYIAGDREDLMRQHGAYMRPLAWATQRLLQALVKNTLTFTAGPLLAEKFGGPNESVIAVIPAVIEPELVVETSTALKRAEKQVKNILFVGSVGKAKGVDVLLRSIRDLKRQGKDVHLRLIGKTTDGGKWLEHQIRSLGLHESVTYVPHMAWDRVIYEYDKSDIFVLPSLAEGMPNVIVEAMARGVPVIASSVGGVPWIIQHGQNGLLVAPGSSSDLTQALLTVIEDQELRCKLALGGVETVRQCAQGNAVDTMVEKVCKAYNLPLHVDTGG